MDVTSNEYTFTVLFVAINLLAATILLNVDNIKIRILVGFLFPFSLVFVVLWIVLRKVARFRKAEKPQQKQQITDSNIILSSFDGGEVEIANPYRGIFILGGAGSGKSRSLIVPIIDQATSKGFTGILYDFKFPELSSEAYWLAKGKPKRAKYFFVNFQDMTRTHRVNPLKNIEESTHAREFATALVSNLMPESITRPEFFSRSAIALLSGAIWFLYQEHREICTLPHVISFLLWPDLAAILSKIEENEISADMVASVKSGLPSEKQTAGVMSTLQMSLSSLSDHKFFYVLSGDDFDLDINSPSNPKFVCIGNSATVSDTLSPLISLIITAALKQMNRKNKEKSLILLDEAPTLYIPNFDQIPATARSNRVITALCTQDYSQMEDKYGSTKAEVILSNLANQFWGNTKNPKTADKVIRLFGKHDKVIETISRGHSSQGLKSSNNQSVSQSIQQRDRLDVTDIRDLDPGEFFISTVETQKKEFRVRLKPAEEHSETLPAFRQVSDQEIADNFSRVKADIKRLFH